MRERKTFITRQFKTFIARHFLSMCGASEIEIVIIYLQETYILV